MPCSTCRHWQPKKNREMEKQHFAACELGKVYTFFPPTHDCPRFRAADADVVAARVKWLEASNAER